MSRKEENAERDRVLLRMLKTPPKKRAPRIQGPEGELKPSRQVGEKDLRALGAPDKSR